ncbi:Ig-like domain-containing protein [Actinoplanes sp. NPDC023801]|uniref:Ig-like domain-containing protein n=1 Tax=Actinoplanes sp. NPDC023801 TaxID=3154595 RepID=UPI0033CB894C
MPVHSRRLVPVFCAALVAAFGAVPAAAAVPEPPAGQVAATGVLVRTIADDFSGGSPDAEQVVVHTGAGSVAVDPASAGDIPSGTRVVVDGDVVTPAPGAGALTASNSVIGTHRLTIVPVYWATATVPDGEPSTAQLRAAADEADGYYDTVSGGKIRMAVDRVAPWTKIADSGLGADGCPDSSALMTAARKVADTTAKTILNHLVVYFPEVTTCRWDGLGSLGFSVHHDAAIWLNGTYDVQTLSHELGHNMYLGHANGTMCHSDAARTVQVPLSQYCTRFDYADPWDVMGNRTAGQLSAYHLAELGLLPADAARTVISDTEVTLAPITSGAGLRQIVMPMGQRTYYIEYRTAAGLDSWTNGDGPYSWAPGEGVVVRYVDPAAGRYSPNETHLAYFQPNGDRVWFRPGLTAGNSWTSPDGQWGLQIDAADSAAARLRIVRAPDIAGPKPFAITSPAAGTLWSHSETDVTWGATADADTAMDRFSVDVDGTTIATIPDGKTSAYVRGLADGEHTLRVNAYDLAGNVTTTEPVTITVDTSAPKVSQAPTAVLHTGRTVPHHAVPVTVAWAVSDPAGVAEQELVCSFLESFCGRTRPSASARTLTSELEAGFKTGWSLTVTDRAGHTGSVAGPATAGTLDGQPARPAKTYAGAWTTTKGRSYLEGSEHTTTARNARATFTVTARSFGWVATRDSTRGSVAVYVDGKPAGTVDLYSASAKARQMVFTRTWPSAGKHTITLVNLATKGHPKAGVDAVALLS